MITIEETVTGQGCPGMKGYDPKGKPWFKAVATDHKGNPATAESDDPYDACVRLCQYLYGRIELDSLQAPQAAAKEVAACS